MIAAHYMYWLVFALMMCGLFAVLSHGNLVKKLIGLTIFQASVFLLYIALGKVAGGTAPIYDKEYELYSHPLPHVLILTAIVVGVSTTALGLALAVRIFHAYGTLEEEAALAAEPADGGAETPESPDRSGGAAS